MNPFAFSLHHSFNEYTQSKIEIYFTSLKSKIAMYERHVEFTSEVYKKEKDEAIAKLNTLFAAPLKKANVEYAVLIKEYGDDMEGHQNAGHESRLDSIVDEISQREYEISEEFTEMSQLFNGQALNQSHSFFEKEISDLCKILKEEFGQVISSKDFSSQDYLKGSYKYIELVIGLDVSKLDTFINKFRDIQYLRNRIVHNHGEFLKNTADKEDSTKTIKNMVKASRGKLELLEEPDMSIVRIVDISYVQEHYLVIRDFFQAIYNLLEEKLNYKILKSRVQYVFSSLSTKPIVEIDKVDYKARSFEINFTIKFPKSSGLSKKLKARLTISKFKNSAVYIEYSGSTNPKMTDFVNNLKSIEHVLSSMLYGYLITSKQVQSALFLSEPKRI